MPGMLRVLVLLAGAGVFACDRSTPPAPSEQGGAEDRAAIELGSSRIVYVPAYSHIGSERSNATLLSVTLSVRNVDPTETVTLNQVDYYDTSGHLVRHYLRAPRPLRPLETAEYYVETFDEAGGSGANFLVYWEGPPTTHPLLTESVMIGHAGAGYLSFTSRGVELDRTRELRLPEPAEAEEPSVPAEPSEPAPPPAPVEAPE